ncbi:hypothetical protein F0562_033286 [Nyssa sinensis]|uniref:Uncharacterized protein n=1 Tax=Nyssa sinensis TaxID=561372 RepID=A0A5J5AVZ1_9ASTE|nr:hypothetical protein F0562_033286 [Nyssa sinensis]
MSASTSVDDVNAISNASGSMIDKKPASSSIVAATAAGNASGSMIDKIPASSSIVAATAAVETMEQSERIVSGDPAAVECCDCNGLLAAWLYNI